MSVLESTLDKLESMARSAVISGGVTAMGYYRGALEQASVLGAEHNPATEADVHATLAVLRSLEPVLPSIAAEADLGAAVFAEELERNDRAPVRDAVDVAVGGLGNLRHSVKRSREAFIRSFPHNVCVLFDALDGTTNFRAGMPLFCSALAVFLGGRPAVGAVYDPHHHVVYTATVYAAGEVEVRRGTRWSVARGISTPLVGAEAPDLSLVATHLSRSDPEARAGFLRQLERLGPAFDGTYMLNCGQLALAWVASGHFAAFVNNRSPIWDIAAGDVLVRAAGGSITDFSGAPVNYGGPERVEVAAARQADVHQRVLRCLGASELA